MKKQENTSSGFTSGYVQVDRRVNSSLPIFKGDGLTLAIFYELVARMAHKPTTDSLGKTKNRVPLEPKQVLTSFRTLAKALGFPKHLIEPRIQKLVDGWPPKIPGLITKVACKDMPGMSVNDGMVITILSGAKFGSQPDTKPDDVKSSSNKTKQFEPPTYDMLVAFAEEKRGKNPKGWSEHPHGMIDEFLAYYSSTDWCTNRGNPIKDWGLAFCRWNNRSDSSSTPSIKAVKRSGNSSRTRSAKAGPEALLASDMAAIGSAA